MKPRILIAEDNPDLLRLLRHHFEGSPFDAEFANTGLLASQLYHSARRDGQPFDLLFFDHAMPMGLGLSVLAEIREEGDWRTPAVLMTALGPEQVEQEARRLKVARIVYKPYDDLVSVVKEVFKEVGNRCASSG